MCCSSKCYGRYRRSLRGFRFGQEQWQNIKEFILERDDFTCQDCGKFLMGDGSVIHHIKYVASGGDNEQGNLITLCSMCHKERHGAIKI